MTKEEGNRLIATIRSLMGDPLGVQANAQATSEGRQVLAQALDGSTLVKKAETRGTEEPRQPIQNMPLEKVFEQFKKWLLDDLREDPVFVHLLAARPELVVEFQVQRVTLQGDTLRGRLARLMHAGWFATTRTTGGCRAELKRTGADPGGGGNLSAALDEFVRQRFLVRDGDGYRLADDVKITEKELVSA